MPDNIVNRVLMPERLDFDMGTIQTIGAAAGKGIPNRGFDSEAPPFLGASKAGNAGLVPA